MSEALSGSPSLLGDWWRLTAKSFVIAFVQVAVSGVLAWLLQWWLAPTWLVGSRAGLGTTLEVVPAVIVALYVFLLGSAFVITEQATTAYSPRAIPLVLLRSGLRHQLIRALVLAVGALLLSGQVPDRGSPSEAVTAAVATIALATATLLPLSALVLAGMFAVHTHPRAFVERVLVGDIENDLDADLRSLASFRIEVLSDMLRRALEHRDRPAVTAACDGLLAVRRAYLNADASPPDAVTAALEDGCDHAEYLGLPARDREPVAAALQLARDGAATAGDGAERRFQPDPAASAASGRAGPPP